MCATLSEDFEHVICGSEDGRVCIWNRFNQFIPTINPAFTGFKEDHNGSIEFFNAYKGAACTVAQFIPLEILQKVSKCFTQYIPPANVREIIVTCSSDGLIRIYYQFLEFS